MTPREENWARNLTYRAREVHRPGSRDDVQRLVAGSDRVRALGTRHSFNGIADTTGDLVDVTSLPFEVDLDADRLRVRVSAGTSYGRLAAYLHDNGFALHNLGSLPHISVAGACATGTHGSGDRNRGLASAVAALELVTGDGDVVDISRDNDPGDFPGTVVSLGALGVVTAVTLDVEPTYDVRQFVYERLPAASFDDFFDEIFAAGYSVSVFTTWRHEQFDQVFLKQRVGTPSAGSAAAEWLGARLAAAARHPLPDLDAQSCTEQGGVPGPWHQRLPHFRLDHTPSSGIELQSEYLVPRHHAVAAVRAVADLRDLVAPLLQICEIRTVAADDLWLSPCYGRDSVGIHFTWVKEPSAVASVVTAVEQTLRPFAARPHWGKLFSTDPETVRGLYERTEDFTALTSRYDPKGTFRNDFLDSYLG